MQHGQRSECSPGKTGEPVNILTPALANAVEQRWIVGAGVLDEVKVILCPVGMCAAFDELIHCPGGSE